MIRRLAAAAMILKEGPVVESDEAKPGVILDYDSEGNIVSIEVLNASKKMEKPIGISFEITPSIRSR